VLLQHNPPFWQPPEPVETPMLWIAGEKDAAISPAAAKASAAYYRAPFHLIKDAGHNLMLAHNHEQTARIIHDWLVQQHTG
jgi:pimeloyl-ACP methyl ester carboxylesterase